MRGDRGFAKAVALPPQMQKPVSESMTFCEGCGLATAKYCLFRSSASQDLQVIQIESSILVTDAVAAIDFDRFCRSTVP